MFDFDSLTAREVALIEDLSGLSISAISAEDQPKGKALAAIALVAKRRDGDPKFTFNQALDLKLTEINALIGLNQEETDAEEKAVNSDETETA